MCIICFTFEWLVYGLVITLAYITKMAQLRQLNYMIIKINLHTKLPTPGNFCLNLSSIH